MKALYHRILGPVLGLSLYIGLEMTGFDSDMAKVAGITLWMAYWWITEALSIYLTALIPVIFFPLFHIMPMSLVAPLYMKEVIFLFIGGFLMAFALERWDLHKRIALKIILMSGATPTRVLFGFMLSSWLLSMWILNTATVTMLIPAALAVIGEIESQKGGATKLTTPYLIGLAYASSIGGMATLIGTAPNIIFMGEWNRSFGRMGEIDFANWMAVGLPISLVLFVLCFFLLKFLFRSSFTEDTIDMSYCRNQYEALGKMSYEEKMVFRVFIGTVLAWFFLKDLNIGSLSIPGWASWIGLYDLKNGVKEYWPKESTVAMLAAGVLMVWPSRESSVALLPWEDVRRLPLGILFLFGGGFALAEAFKVSGLTVELGSQMAGISEFQGLIVVLCLCTFMTFLTELTSNTASIILFIPVMFSFAQHLNVHPLEVYIPVTLAASAAFMLPVATPPNTIVFGSERLKVKDMVRTGIWMNLIAIIVITLLSRVLVGLVFG